MPRTMTPEREAQIRDMNYVAASKRVKELLAELDAERAVSAEALNALELCVIRDQSLGFNITVSEAIRKAKATL